MYQIFCCRPAWTGLWLLVALCSAVGAGELLMPGDAGFRSDVQMLSDARLIDAPVSVWPLSSETLLDQIHQPQPPTSQPGYLQAAWLRVWQRLQKPPPPRAASLTAVNDPVAIRRFADTPRTSGAELQINHSAGPVIVRLSAQVGHERHEDRFRLDGSFLGVRWRNWLVSAGLVPRWWGPGHESSLILSGNARPVPAVAFDTLRPIRFQIPVLSWLGPLHWSVFAGKLEGARYVPDVRLLGARATFRPTPGLEIGLSRTAQWAGDGRPDDLDSFLKLLIGRDNSGDAGITLSNEPGNQLGGIDLRWVAPVGNGPYAVYTQWIGEDEAGGLPSRYVALAGVEFWRTGQDDRPLRWYIEAADTAIEFYKTDARYNLAYEHFIYRDGYRYRGRSIGHAMDNDSIMYSIGVIGRHDATRWQGAVRRIRVNRDGASRIAPHSVAPTGQNRWELIIGVRQPLFNGALSWGLNLEYIDPRQAATKLDLLWHAEWTRAW